LVVRSHNRGRLGLGLSLVESGIGRGLRTKFRQGILVRQSDVGNRLPGGLAGWPASMWRSASRKLCDKRLRRLDTMVVLEGWTEGLLLLLLDGRWTGGMCIGCVHLKHDRWLLMDRRALRGFPSGLGLRSILCAMRLLSRRGLAG